MKLYFNFFLILLIIGANTQAQLRVFSCGYQGYQTVEQADDYSDICELYNSVHSGEKYEEALLKVEQILDKVGLFRNFEVEECGGINNAIAVTIPLKNGDLDRYIIYDNLFFQKVKDATNTDWGLISILAHEIGHHLNGHTLTGTGSTHQTELQADEFSGFVLARMGCSLKDAQSAIDKMLPEKGSSTHPEKSKRLQAVEKGWNRGNGKSIKVEEIKEEVIVQIIENKISEEDVKDVIDAEQILAQYIKAIGGQEAISKIKTMQTKQTTTSHIKNTLGLTTTETKDDIVYLRPSYFFNNSSSGEMLGLGGKVYMKKLNDQWAEYENPEAIPGSKSDGASASYVKEFAYLVNNTDIRFEGIKQLDGKEVYVLKLPTKEVSNEGLVVVEIDYLRYYDVKTFLLIATEEIWKYVALSSDPMIYTTYYSDYRNVDGVLFPFKQHKVMNIPSYNLDETLQIESMKTNVPVDASLFTIENKETYVQSEEVADIAVGFSEYSKGNKMLYDATTCNEGFEIVKKAAESGLSIAFSDLAALYNRNKMRFYYCHKVAPVDDERKIFWNFKYIRNVIGSYWASPDVIDKSTFKYVINPSVKSIKSSAKVAGGLTKGQQEFLEVIDLISANKSDEALEKLKQSAESGFVDAQFALARHYLLKMNMEERMKWLKKASDQKDPEALLEIKY